MLAPGPPGLAGLFLALLWMTWTEVGIVPLAGYVRPTHGQKASLSGPGGSGSIRQWSWVGSLLEEGHVPSLPGGSDVGRPEAPCHGCVMRARGVLFKRWSWSALDRSRQPLSVGSPSPGSVAGRSRLPSDVALLLDELSPGPRQLDPTPGTLGICPSWGVCTLSGFMLFSW